MTLLITQLQQISIKAMRTKGKSMNGLKEIQ